MLVSAQPVSTNITRRKRVRLKIVNAARLHGVNANRKACWESGSVRRQCARPSVSKAASRRPHHTVRHKPPLARGHDATVRLDQLRHGWGERGCGQQFGGEIPEARHHRRQCPCLFSADMPGRGQQRKLALTPRDHGLLNDFSLTESTRSPLSNEHDMPPTWPEFSCPRLTEFDDEMHRGSAHFYDSSPVLTRE